MDVSVVIPFSGKSAYLRQTLAALAEVEHDELEIILAPDRGKDVDAATCAAAGTRLLQIVPTGPLAPGVKRDIALNYAQGDIVAFLDDDTYPAPEWLTAALPHFADPQIAAIGGPAITPPHDPPLARASGAVYASWLGGGAYRYRYLPGTAQDVDDYPTCNLLVRRSILQQLGGFDTAFWPGEDTKLCLDITQGLGLRIRYEPRAVVYHHRRALFKPHLRQVRQYALHRGYFAKRLPATSRRFSYFLPSLLTAGLLAGLVLALKDRRWRIPYALGVGAYLSAAGISAAQAGGQRLMLPVAAGIVLTHVTYGVWFLAGLAARRLPEEDERRRTKDESQITSFI